MIKVVVSYVKAAVEIVLDYNSKNKRFGQDGSEAVTVTDTPEISTAYTRSPEDAVTVAEQIVLNTQWNLEFTETLSSSDALSGWSLDRKIDDSITTGDTPGIGAIHKVNPSDSISVSDARTMWHDGMLNTNMINTRLIGVGSTEVSEDDVNIT